MKTLSPLLVVAVIMSLQLSALAQGVIGGNQNGLGSGGYLPKPPGGGSAPIAARQFTSSLAVPGYDFQLVEISGQPVRLVVDSPAIVPLATASHSTVSSNSLGFVATFVLDNKTAADRTIQFLADYYANLRVGFRVLDSNDNVVWQSYQLLVDIPPLTPPTTLTLSKHSFWKNQVFVPIYSQGAAVLAPGDYTLEAEVLGTPAYSSRTPFTVSISVGGPLVPPTPAVK